MPTTAEDRYGRLKAKYEKKGYRIELRTHHTEIKSGTDYPCEIWFFRRYRCGWVARGRTLSRILPAAAREIKTLVANGAEPLGKDSI